MTEATIKERPILFSAPMVQAILADRKTQTRRVVNMPHGHGSHGGFEARQGDDADWYLVGSLGWDGATRLPCRYGKPGDQLWVRETWQQVMPTEGGEWHTVKTPRPRDEADGFRQLLYAADIERDEPPPWRPSIFMPRWASRITLEITEVRVERLHDISTPDAIAEGFAPWKEDESGISPTHRFASLWEKINGKKHPWKSNPWLWVISFKRITKGTP